MIVDRLKLLHGPYVSPRVKRGDIVFCHLSDRDIMVGRMSDAPIQWPLRLKRGRGSLILFGDLVRAVQFESAIAVAHHWGVSLVTVWSWRKVLGVKRINEGTLRLYRDYKPTKLTDDAAALGRAKASTPESIAKMASSKIGKPSHPNTRAALIASATGRKQSPDHIRKRIESSKVSRALNKGR